MCLMSLNYFCFGMLNLPESASSIMFNDHLTLYVTLAGCIVITGLLSFVLLTQVKPRVKSKEDLLMVECSSGLVESRRRASKNVRV